jgi:hypothetical protein
MPTPSIALVGDYNPDVTAHRAIPLAIELASRESEPPGVTWLSTEALVSTPDDALFSGISRDQLECRPSSDFVQRQGGNAKRT